ncbi:MAG TPA: hypothetical protein VMG60_19370 [Burkholderiaceae bacterium]|nr:hypothetical protein [Burkholderiaceae bacterium]
MSVPFAEVPGVPCPGCGARLVVTMEQLLSFTPIACTCGLVLEVDPERSEETLRDLRALHDRLAQLRS